MKSLFLLLLALTPLAAHAQYDGYEEYKANIARGEEDRRMRAANDQASAAEAARVRYNNRYNRYDSRGNYILGSNPNDTPYNTYPGPTLDKHKMAEWRAFRDEYKARKARDKDRRAQGKANEKAYKDDQKAHGGTIALPGGYRTVKGKGGGIITPEGKLVGEDNRKNRKYLENNKAATSYKTPVPAPKPQPAQKPQKSEAQNLREMADLTKRMKAYNDMRDAERAKAAAKPAQKQK